MDKDNNFVHLHVHSEYSLLDGSSKIKELVSRTKALGMDAIAITDHGVMFGVIDFYKEAMANGIRPILGCEVYVASGSRFNTDNSNDNFYYHLVLLAENNEGYHNLIKLVSYGFTEGFYYKPRVDIELLKKYNKGIIALSACLAGPVAKNILNVSYQKALETALLYNSIFGDGNFYLELQDHGIKEQKNVNSQLVRMSKETGIPLVCTNDLHYIYKEDAKAHEILLCIQTGKNINDTDRMIYEGSEFYLKSAQEMYELFPYAKEGLLNTKKIADRCNVSIEFNNYKLPKFIPPAGKDTYSYLMELCSEGLKERYGEITNALKERLEYEINVIHEMGFVEYFLVVWDFIKYAKDNHVAVGPGRGSSAGSLVAYSLKITNIDPIKYNLIFERFLNPERISMPDIDIDFCYERRQEVIDYVVKKYGEDHVAQIITFGTMAARGAIRDVGRAIAYPYNDVDRIAKMIPFAVGMTIATALKMNSQLGNAYETEEDTKYLIDMAMRLEGLPRHASTHAAGVVISNSPVLEYVPLNVNDNVVTTQFPMNTIEELGLLKMDFLGLRTLTVIQNAVKEIKRNYKIDIDLDKLDYADPSVFAIIAAAKTEGVFQLESPGMKSFMKELAPSRMEDIIAGISLYRPGPMDFIPKYIRGKNNADSTSYTHPLLEPILKDTYGCIVYQEQVLQIVRDLAGYSMGRSDLVRRAMSKKKADVMLQERKNFVYGLENVVPGCVAKGIPVEAAEKIFDEMTDFAKYAFPKSHAAAYAVIGYQTAWLKVYYPIEFMAALMTSVMDFTAKVAEYIEECRKMNITLLPPDINEGYAHFSVDNGQIRFGLLAIKNVGRNTIDALVHERSKNGSFKGLRDFIERMESKDLNKRCIESLIKAGAFDSLGGKRAQYLSVYQQIINGIAQSKKMNIEGQLNLFDMGSFADEYLNKDELPDIDEYDKNELLDMEKDVLGIYVSGHPLSAYTDILNKYTNVRSLDFINEENYLETNNGLMYDGKEVVIGGIIASKSVKFTKNNKAMAFINLEDELGSVEVIVFPNIYEKLSANLTENAVILVKGKATIREEENGKIICDEIILYNKLKKYEESESKELWLKIPKDKEIQLSVISDVLMLYPGYVPVIIYNEKKKEKIKVREEYWVDCDDLLIEELKSILGESSVVIKERVV